jgi:5-methylcytosine-specific restriction endonuclease McrA
MVEAGLEGGNRQHGVLMPSLLKEKNYRNPRLLRLAEKSPICCICGKPNDGTVVACHSNSIQDGHGTGIKAHDLPAFGCRECHDRVDGRIDKHLTRDERALLFYRGVYNTWLLCMREGWLK